MSQSSPGDELVEVVDRRGRVLDVVTRRVMRRDGLAHRSTYVMVVQGELPPGWVPPRSWDSTIDLGLAAAQLGLDGASRVVVHQRAGWKDVNPSYWDIGFGGVCGVGEPWLVSARRELAEEAGLRLPLFYLGPGYYRDDTTEIVARCFLAVGRDEPRCHDGEVVSIDTVAVDDLDPWARRHDVCPDSVDVLMPFVKTISAR